MKYRVVLHRLALEDLESAYEWVARNAPVTAAQWLDRFQDALLTLESFPQRQPLARENRKVDVELREFLFGKSDVFRVIFTIDGDTVRILRIRRSQRRSLTRDEINQSIDAGPEPN
jgi:plasmid stabilization system protein ParE